MRQTRRGQPSTSFFLEYHPSAIRRIKARRRCGIARLISGSRQSAVLQFIYHDSSLPDVLRCSTIGQGKQELFWLSVLSRGERSFAPVVRFGTAVFELVSGHHECARGFRRNTRLATVPRALKRRATGMMRAGATSKGQEQDGGYCGKDSRDFIHRGIFFISFKPWDRKHQRKGKVTRICVSSEAGVWSFYGAWRLVFGVFLGAFVTLWPARCLLSSRNGVHGTGS